MGFAGVWKGGPWADSGFISNFLETGFVVHIKVTELSAITGLASNTLLYLAVSKGCCMGIEVALVTFC